MLPAPDRTGGNRVFAVLGPTNTGKTHLAIERMLGHATGMIGFPLRLLARENYDRVVRVKGRTRVALITGEEKILPPNAQYFVCTVESMPLDRPVEFLAVDEIQLCADRERGHVFTQRLLGARGLSETMFLGADTMRGMIRRLVPAAEFISRPRFSELSYVGEKKLTRMPRRSAVVAFSASDVYHTAELLRRQRGGTAVVLGALSPRTRNAQVEMYQAGEVDYLVATDAIGMGLNMDVDHVAFARLVKFDGQTPRHLRATEIAQIAGRAGRHMSDGTFGTTDGVGGIDEDVVEAVENHVFEPVRHLMWRNSDLDFRDPKALIASLESRPPVPDLRRAPEADDHLSLRLLARDPDLVRRAAGSRAATRLLWDICQIPDFRKTLTDAHARLLRRVWDQLTGPDGRLDPDWVARQVDRLDRSDGDIDTLVQRISHIRTWTFISHRSQWLAEPSHWQQRARAIEDRLSDALHDRLTQRFVDRRSAMLAKTLADGRDLLSAVSRSGEVLVEGAFVGRLEGFRFAPDAVAHGEDARQLMSAARRALRPEIAGRVKRLEAEDDDAAFALDDDGTVRWHGEAVGRLAAGAALLAPRVEPLRSDLLEPSGRDRVARRLTAFVEREVARELAPLFRLKAAELGGGARGLAFQLIEELGTLPRDTVKPLVDGLTKGERRRLAQLGVRLGARWIWLEPLTRPRAVAMRARLAAVDQGMALPPPVPAAGAPSVPRDRALPPGWGPAIGYVPAGDRLVRVDRLEALIRLAERLHRDGPFKPPVKLAQLAGCPMDDLPSVLSAVGYRAVVGEDGETTWRRPRNRSRREGRHRGKGADAAAESPFAKLQALGGGR